MVNCALLVAAQTLLAVVLSAVVDRLKAELARRLSCRRAIAGAGLLADTPQAPLLHSPNSAVPKQPLGTLLHSSHSWGDVVWSTLQLRDGPNYKRNRIKRPALPPLLPVVGMEAFRSPRKTFTDCSEEQASCMPPEVLEAARSTATTGLPRFLIISVNVPSYAGPAPDGPVVKFAVYFAVPPSIASEPSGAARLLCEFLRGAASGHRDPGSNFYDRFKVICRLVSAETQASSTSLRGMISRFNGKPMLWRFFGVWGNCVRRGAVVAVNLDFCTGGRVKNAALLQCVQRSGGFVVDMSWALESRSDAEMPERIIGGVTLARLNVADLPELEVAADGGSLRVRAGGEPRADAGARSGKQRASAAGGVLQPPPPRRRGVAALLVSSLLAAAMAIVLLRSCLGALAGRPNSSLPCAAVPLRLM